MNPLTGRTILVTRSADQSGPLAETLRVMGARVIEAPVIDFVDPEDWAPADDSVSRIALYDFVIFTSSNAVDRFARRMRLRGVSWPANPGPRVIAIGPATGRALAACGMPADKVAPDSRAEGVIELLSDETLAGTSVLIPRAAAARELLVTELRARGARVDVVTIYRTVAVAVTTEAMQSIRDGEVDVVTFTSASTVTNLLLSIGGPGALDGVEIAVIGPVTARAASDAGLVPTIVSPGAGMEEFARAIAGRYSGQR